MGEECGTMVDNKPESNEVVLRVPVECYSRIVGYLRPIQNWNTAKQQEFHDRVTFNMEKALENPHPQVQQPIRHVE